MRQDVFEDENIVNWASNVKKLLPESGFNDVWIYPTSEDIKTFIPALRRRIFDLYIGRN